MGLEENVGKRKLKKNIKLLIVFIIVLVVLVGSYFGFNKLFNDPYTVYTNLINDAHDKIIDYLEKANDNKIKIEESDVLRGTFNLKLQSSIENFIPYTKYKYGMDVIIDSKNKKMEEVLSISDFDTGKKKFDIGFYLDKDTYLMQSKYMYNNTLDLSNYLENMDLDSVFEGFDSLNDSLQTKDLEYLTTSIKDSILKAIDKKTLKSKYDKIKIKGKNINVIRFDYELDKKVLNDIYGKLADSLLDNSEFIAIMSKLLSVTPEEIEKNLNDYRDSFTKADSFTISIYKKIFSKEIVKFNLITADEFEINYFEKLLSFKQKKDEIIIDMRDKKTNVSVIVEGEKLINLKIKDIKANIIDLDYEINVEDQSFSGEVYVNAKKKSETSEFLEYSFSLLTKIDGENVNFRIFGDASCYITENMNLIDKENIKKLEDIDQNTFKSIYNKGYSNLQDTPFITYYEYLFS